MNLLLTKLRISFALDSNKPLPDSLRQKIEASAGLQHFVRQLRPLEENPPRPAGVDVMELHNGIMRAVRVSARKGQPARAPVFGWLTAAAAISAVVVVSLWMARPAPSRSEKISFEAPQAVLDMSQEMETAAPAAVLAPLTNEWAKVNRDVENTGAVFANAFPF